MAMILNEEQTMLKDSAKDFCANNTPIGQLRKLRDESSADGFDRGSWKGMVDLGWAAIPWGEEHGGLAFGYKGLGVVTEESVLFTLLSGWVAQSSISVEVIRKKVSCWPRWRRVKCFSHWH